LFSSYGIFDQQLEERLKKGLLQLPKEDLVIMCNHFPLHKGKKRKRHELIGSIKLEALLKQFPNVKLYLHGHNHTHQIMDLRDEHLPICIDAGSAAHQHKGSFNLYDVTQERIVIHGMQAHHFLPPNIHWEKFFEQTYEF
jgi:Icc-related predicted phosphoesterase